jgi:hypothetical protein
MEIVLEKEPLFVVENEWVELAVRVGTGVVVSVVEHEFERVIEGVVVIDAEMDILKVNDCDVTERVCVRDVESERVYEGEKLVEHVRENEEVCVLLEELENV